MQVDANRYFQRRRQIIIMNNNKKRAREKERHFAGDNIDKNADKRFQFEWNVRFFPIVHSSYCDAVDKHEPVSVGLDFEQYFLVQFDLFT